MKFPEVDGFVHLDNRSHGVEMLLLMYWSTSNRGMRRPSMCGRDM